MQFDYLFLIFIFSILLSFIATILVRKLALMLKVVDIPNEERKIHKEAMPLLGGVGIFFAFSIILYLTKDNLLLGNLRSSHWIGFIIGGIFLMIGGYLDDKYRLKPLQDFIWPVLAIFCVIAGGVGIEKVTNPFGGFLYLDMVKIPIVSWAGEMHYLVLFSDTIIFLWLLGMMYTTKLLDGLDGLVTGVSAIGGFIIFLFTMTTKYYQPDIGLAALVLTGACLGFLLMNWHPAKIFLGEGGSLFLGYSLGVLSIISGGKMAIALLVLGLPILDVAWVIIRRLRAGKNPLKFADRQHLHFKLLDAGIGTRKTVLIYYFFAFSFGLSALFLQSVGKFLALVVLAVIMLLFVSIFYILDKKKKDENQH